MGYNAGPIHVNKGVTNSSIMHESEGSDRKTNIIEIQLSYFRYNFIIESG